MARSVEARLERSGRPGRVTRARAEELPFADSSFDTVVATMVLCSVGDVGRALAEIQRVLRPGGRFLFLEHVRSDDPRTARRQDRLRGAWSWFARGCRCNQSTIELLEGTFSVEHLERGELPLAPSIVRPLVTGTAVPARRPGSLAPGPAGSASIQRFAPTVDSVGRRRCPRAVRRRAAAA